MMETLKCESQSQMQLSPTHTEHPPLTNTVVWRVCTLRQITHTHTPTHTPYKAVTLSPDWLLFPNIT